jgi:2-polyprenyl-3-methyl-5-hydroxy-6-metoxy-1,4-benzoquinol methylase
MSGWARDRQPEWMDEPALDAKAHRRALSGLRRINKVSRTAAQIWRPIAQLARNTHDRPLRVLDLACGGGDVLIACARRLRSLHLNVELHGVDRSETAIHSAQHLAQHARIEEVQFSRLDVLQDAIPRGYDVVMSTLFLHHLAELDASRLLQRMAEATRQAVLVDDLLRSRSAFGMAWIACRVLTRSPIVRLDGPLSVRAAFTLEELRLLCKRAGLANATYKRHWPARVLIQWNKP